MCVLGCGVKVLCLPPPEAEDTRVRVEAAGAPFPSVVYLAKACVLADTRTLGWCLQVRTCRWHMSLLARGARAPIHCTRTGRVVRATNVSRATISCTHVCVCVRTAWAAVARGQRVRLAVAMVYRCADVCACSV